MKAIKELEMLIKKHKALYYSGHPEISDESYDQIEEELRKLDPDNPVLSLVGALQESEGKEKHDKKMLSLEKTYAIEDVIKWSKGEELIVLPKVDGMSCSLIYKNGVLVKAKTRGDGEYGENITSKVKWITDLPKKINLSGEIRGELYCSLENFLKLSEEMEKLKLPKPSSKRNIVAGLVSRKDYNQLATFLSFFAFDYIANEETIIKENLKLEKLKAEGFSIPDYEIISSKEEIIIQEKKLSLLMDNQDILYDGLVFTINNCKLHDEMGETIHHPKYKIAFKLKGESKTTSIKMINWFVSRNGVLTPVAQIEPIELSGAKIENVTLHNYGVIKQFNLKIGDKIEVVRSGEVIPKFIQVVSQTSGNYEIPNKCPSCGKEIIKEEIRLVCKNKECPERKLGSILHFVSTIGIEDLSEKRLKEMLTGGLIKEIPDLYVLKIEDLLRLEKTKEKLANKLFQNIQVSKKTNLPKFLSALGISGGAIGKCEKIVNAGIDSIDKIQAMSVEDLVKVDGFAEKSANEFVSSIKEKNDLITKLIQNGIEIIKEEKGDALKGISVVITGELSVNRKDFEKLIKKNGGIVSSSPNKDTTYLICNEEDSSSSKFLKAKKLNIKTIKENEFLNLYNLRI